MKTMLTLLYKENFGDAKWVCLGSQLGDLLELAKRPSQECMWFIADVSMTKVVPDLEWPSDVCKQIGNTDRLIELVCQVDQFESGVFIAVPPDLAGTTEGVGAETESPRGVIVEGSWMEIRVFDTSYFEVYTTRPDLAEALHERFGSRFELL